jgi:hypothetical protein
MGQHSHGGDPWLTLRELVIETISYIGEIMTKDEALKQIESYFDEYEKNQRKGGKPNANESTESPG